MLSIALSCFEPLKRITEGHAILFRWSVFASVVLGLLALYAGGQAAAISGEAYLSGGPAVEIIGQLLTAFASNFSTLAMSLLASLCFGALIGFIMAIPTSSKILDNDADYVSNNSIEEISKLAVTVLLGATAAKFSWLELHFRAELNAVALSLKPSASTAVPGMVVTIGMICGFAGGYYWTKTKYPYLMRKWDRKRLEAIKQNGKLCNATIPTALKATAAKPWQVKVDYLKEGLSPNLRADDPYRDQFGGEQSGTYTVSAMMDKSKSDSKFREVKLTIASAPEANESARSVAVLLHPSFPYDAFEFSFESDNLEVSFETWRLFTVGIIVREKRADGSFNYTPLEFPLSKSKNADLKLGLT